MIRTSSDLNHLWLGGNTVSRVRSPSRSLWGRSGNRKLEPGSTLAARQCDVIWQGTVIANQMHASAHPCYISLQDEQNSSTFLCRDCCVTGRKDSFSINMSLSPTSWVVFQRLTTVHPRQRSPLRRGNTGLFPLCVMMFYNLDSGWNCSHRVLIPQ